MSGAVQVVQRLVSQKKAGPAVASFTTFTRIINDEDVYSIQPPLLSLGSLFEIEALINVSNVVTAAPYFAFQVKLGGQVAWTSDNLVTKATASAALPMWLRLALRVDSIGKTSAAKLIGSGFFHGAAFNPTFGMLQAASLAVGTGFGTTSDDGSAALDFGAVCQTSNASNALQVMSYKVDLTL